MIKDNTIDLIVKDFNTIAEHYKNELNFTTHLKENISKELKKRIPVKLSEDKRENSYVCGRNDYREEILDIIKELFD